MSRRDVPKVQAKIQGRASEGTLVTGEWFSGWWSEESEGGGSDQLTIFPLPCRSFPVCLFPVCFFSRTLRFQTPTLPAFFAPPSLPEFRCHPMSSWLRTGDKAGSSTGVGQGGGATISEKHGTLRFPR